MIETVAFDFGQVIGFFDHGRTFNKLEFYSALSPAEMNKIFFDSDLEDAFESGRIGEDEFLQRVRTLLGLRCDKEAIAAAVADIFWPNEALCTLVPLLKTRYRLVLGSNTNPIHARHFVPQFKETLRHFDALILSHEVSARKPGREFFREIIRVAGCRAESCVFIDDLAANIAGARACGLQGIVYSDIDDLRRSLEELGVSLSH
jgi:putative hydrolase of the HAD superfamily